MNKLAGKTLEGWAEYRELFARFGEKWSIPIILRPADSDSRFNGLHRDLDGVSKKVLAQTLRSLERDGVIRQECRKDQGLGVNCQLSDIGWSYLQTLEPLVEWAKDIHPKIVQAQRSSTQATKHDVGRPD